MGHRVLGHRFGQNGMRSTITGGNGTRTLGGSRGEMSRSQPNRDDLWIPETTLATAVYPSPIATVGTQEEVLRAATCVLEPLNAIA